MNDAFSPDSADPLPFTGMTPYGRPSWSGLLQFSLVGIPLKAYPAVRTRDVPSAHLLHADCGERIRYAKQCPLHGTVDSAAIVRGYEYGPGRHVIAQPDELDALRGVRALAAVEGRGCRLWGREQADYTARYPELNVLRRLPAGTLVDGELVACDEEGRPDLRRLLRRHGLTDPWRIRHARHWCPVRYVVFDLLYHTGCCLMRAPLLRRREVLAEVCEKLDVTEVEFSPAVIGAGTMLYQTVVTAGHEGVMAKQIRSVYRPGKRSVSWKKIKPW